MHFPSLRLKGNPIIWLTTEFELLLIDEIRQNFNESNLILNCFPLSSIFCSFG